MLKVVAPFFLGVLLGCSTNSVKSESPSSLANASCEGGTVRHGFLTPTTQGDVPCAESMQSCVSGQWQGPALFETCENHTKSCDATPHGSIVNGFVQPHSPKGFPCQAATKTCIDGLWIGPDVFETGPCDTYFFGTPRFS